MMKKKIIIGILSLAIIGVGVFCGVKYKINTTKDYLQEVLTTQNCSPEVEFDKGTFKVIYENKDSDKFSNETIDSARPLIIKGYKDKYNKDIKDDNIKKFYNIEIIYKLNDGSEYVNIRNGELNE